MDEAKKTYAVLDSLRHNKQQYSPSGDNNTVELTEKEAAPLLRAGVIAEGETTPTAPTAPEGEERVNLIKQAIAGLDTNNAELFTKGGVAKTEAIAAVTGWPVSGKERDEVLALIAAETPAVTTEEITPEGEAPSAGVEVSAPAAANTEVAAG